MPLIYIVLHALTGLMCEETSWVSVALMEMSMEISTCSRMSAQQNKGKYRGNSEGNTVFEKTKNEKQFLNIPALLCFASITHYAILSSLKLPD